MCILANFFFWLPRLISHIFGEITQTYQTVSETALLSLASFKSTPLYSFLSQLHPSVSLAGNLRVVLTPPIPSPPSPAQISSTSRPFFIFFHFSLSVLLSLSLPAAAAAKSLQSCPTLCGPRDGSPPGSSVPGILQARTLEWVAIDFPGSSDGKTSAYSAGDPASIPGLGRCPGEGNGNALQYSCPPPQKKGASRNIFA